MEQRVVYRTREMQRIEARLGRSIDEILRDLYLTRGLTVEQVGVELGITKGAASRWLDRFDVAIRRSGQRPAAVA